MRACCSENVRLVPMSINMFEMFDWSPLWSLADAHAAVNLARGHTRVRVNMRALQNTGEPAGRTRTFDSGSSSSSTSSTYTIASPRSASAGANRTASRAPDRHPFREVPAVPRRAGWGRRLRHTHCLAAAGACAWLSARARQG